MAKRQADAIPLSRFGVLVAQLESIVASARQQPPDAVLCFDLLSELVAAIEEEPKESIQLWQRKCEDALYSLLILGARRPVRRLASSAMGRVIEKGDAISIYSRVSTLQGWLADGKKNEAMSCSGAAQCLGELYHLFGRRITAGLVETANIAAKLMKFNEDFARQDALQLLENALEGSCGSGASAAYSEAFRIIMRLGVGDKSFMVRLAAARCLKTFASIGAPGLGINELENSISVCLKGMEDQVSSVRDAFAEALGALVALAMSPEAQVKKRGKNQPPQTKKLEDDFQKHLILPFVRASGINAKKLRVGLALSWAFFLQVIHLKYHFSDYELQNFALQAMEMLRGNGSSNPHALACVIYILRVGIVDQMTEPTQRDFLVLLGKKLESSDCSPPMRVAILRILSYLLTILGEVPTEFKDILDNTVVAALSESSVNVRVEAALTLRALAEVDPTCVGGLISYGVTTLNALRENVLFNKGNNLQVELDSLHGQATVLAALVAISPKLHLGYPARLPKSVFEVSKKMLTEFSRNTVAAVAEREAGWLLLAALIASMPKEELEDQVFDVLLLWADPFTGNPESYLRHVQDWPSELRVLSVAIEALTAFINSFISPSTAATNGGILLNPVLAYLSGALSLVSFLCSNLQPNIKPVLDLFTAKVLMVYQSISNPLAYISEHAQILQICASPFSNPSGWEESSCLRFLLDKRDACLGPWIPGRDSFEDELRAFDGGSDGILPSMWDYEICIFPQPESVSKMLVNQMLLCYGTMFACQDNGGKSLLLNKIDHCLKTGKKQSWYMTCITNACVGLLSGLKAMLSLRLHSLSSEILTKMQSIFQAILEETEISSSQRRAACEGIGLLGRVGNDTFTARMTRYLLGELVTAKADPNYTGSIALSLGCIHRSAGGMALSTLVPPTVSSISLITRNLNANVQLWSLHALLLTVEAAGLSFVPQVQATLVLAMEILLLEESGNLALRQEIGHLVNAIVAVIGPELAPGSTFFSRCKSVITEISSCKETATLLESVRFTQQLVLFAPQAVTVHSHVRSLIPTLSSRRPSLRYLAVSTLHHLIERDAAAMINENIEEYLFTMLDEETDSEIVSLVRATIQRLLYTSCPLCPSRWLFVLRNMVLASSVRRNTAEGLSNLGNNQLNDAPENNLSYGEDDEGMIGNSKGEQERPWKNKNLRYRTRVFAAECLSYLPDAVGTEPAHFDLLLARNHLAKGRNDWLVLKLQELVSLSYQISTGQFEGMQPIGVRLLCVVMDKFGKAPDPDFPGHILLEQYQAQLVSAVRSAISTASGPLLLDAGLELATKIMTSSIIGGDRVALNRLFLLISHPLSDILDLRYPSFADWVACKIKVRLLTAHASVKIYTYQYLRKLKNVPDEYLQLIPLLANSSTVLGKHWVSILKDYIFICFQLHSKFKYKPFLEGIDSLLVSSKVHEYLNVAWPLILQAIALDAIPAGFEIDEARYLPENSYISGRSMVKLECSEFQFIWGFSLLVLFQAQQTVVNEPIKMLLNVSVDQRYHDLLIHDTNNPKQYEISLPIFVSLSKEAFFIKEFLSLEICQELVQVLLYADCSSSLAIGLLSQIIQFCPDSFFEVEDFAFALMELCSHPLVRIFQSYDANQDYCSTLFSQVSTASENMASRMKNKQQRWRLAISLISICHQVFERVSTNLCLSKVTSFLQNIMPSMKKIFKEGCELNEYYTLSKVLVDVWVTMLSCFSKYCIKQIGNLNNMMSDSCKVLERILMFSLGETVALVNLVYETVYLRQKETNADMLISSIFKHCVQSVQVSLCSDNMQVQILGLKVLKNVAQREIAEGSQMKSHFPFVLLVGDLLGDIISVLQNASKKCSSRESITIIDECLRLLFLFHTLAQSRKCQQAVTMLLLEALSMVFFVSSSRHSQEFIEVNTISRRLISHLVQIPSSATQIKEVMLSVPATQRQKIQDMIRASVSQGEMTTQTASSAQTGPNAKDAEISDPEFTTHFVEHNAQEFKETQDEDEDDWDSFQSLPAINTLSSKTSIDKDEVDAAEISCSSTIDEHKSMGSSHGNTMVHTCGVPGEALEAKDSVIGEDGHRSPVKNEMDEPSSFQCFDDNQITEGDEKGRQSAELSCEAQATKDSEEYLDLKDCTIGVGGYQSPKKSEMDELSSSRCSDNNQIIECGEESMETRSLSCENQTTMVEGIADDTVWTSTQLSKGDEELVHREESFESDAVIRSEGPIDVLENPSDDLPTVVEDDKSNFNQIIHNHGSSDKLGQSTLSNNNRSGRNSGDADETQKVHLEGDLEGEGDGGGSVEHSYDASAAASAHDEQSNRQPVGENAFLESLKEIRQDQ